MKLIKDLICFIFLANAQSGMLNGTGYAPDITVTDINGNTNNLYSYLSSDKVVVLELMSTTCGYCQQYTSGTENSYQVYGPNGSLGQGGDGTTYSAGSGGGGYYGGSPGGSNGGGGGSSYVTASGSSSITHTQGYNTGNGEITISW